MRPTCANTPCISAAVKAVGDVAAPERHVDGGMLAAEEGRDPERAERVAHEGPQEHRLICGIEADDQAGRHARHGG